MPPPKNRSTSASPADYYFAQIPAPLDEIANALRKLVRATLPEAEERIYLCAPNYHFAYIADHKKHVNRDSSSARTSPTRTAASREPASPSAT